MDRKGWIILILCSAGLMYLWNDMKKTDKLMADKAKAELVVSDKEKAAAEKAKVENPETSFGLVVAPVKEELVTLNSLDGERNTVIYTFTSKGGGVKFAEMQGEKKVFDDEFVKINEKSKFAVGSLAKGYKDIERVNYKLTEQGKNFVVYQGQLEEGVTVTKSWTVENGTEEKAHNLKLTIKFTIAEGKSVNLGNYSLTTGTATPLFLKEQSDRSGWFFYEDGDYNHDMQGEFTGGMFSDKKSVVTKKVESLEFIGVDNQFFTTTIFPANDSKGDNIWVTGSKFDIEDGKRWQFYMGTELPNKTLSAGEKSTFTFDIFMGVKSRKMLNSLSSNSETIINDGWWTWLGTSKFMSWALNGIHNWFPEGMAGSWGLAIILLTIFIRIVIWPLHNKSTRTMKRMGKLQPIMKELKEKHKDNPQKLNQETMKLYKEYGVNPMGGCLPMLVQIPIFFGVFKMITAEVSLRGQSFLWVKDLSQPDTLGYFPIGDLPINALPFLMVITMVIQMRMTPQTGDKLQRRIFMLMPLMFFFFCYGYAAALALYWTTQNIVSIGQTWLTQRMPEPELEKKSIKLRQAAEADPDKPRKKGLMEKMAEKLEEAQNQRDIAAGKGPMKKAVGKDVTVKKPKKRDPKTGG